MKTKIILLLLTVTLSACGAKKKSIDREKVKKVEHVETEKTKIEVDKKRQENITKEQIYAIARELSEGYETEIEPIDETLPSSVIRKGDSLFFQNARIRSKKKPRTKRTNLNLKEKIKKSAEKAAQETNQHFQKKIEAKRQKAEK